MMATEQNPFVLCGKCWQEGECEAVYSGEFTLTGYTRRRVCSCMPKRICVHLDLFEYGVELPTATISTSLSIECESQSYSGTINDPDKVELIDFALYYVQNDETKQCFFALESSSLGYTGDDTLLIPMGGPYNDGATRREECLAFDWQFSVTVNALAPYLDDAVIRVTADDLVSVPRNCVSESLCFSPRVCISYQDSYGAVTTKKVCFIDQKWQTTFADAVLGYDIAVQVEIDNFDVYLGRLCEEVPTLRLTSTLDPDLTSPASVEADCPAMIAEWLFSGGQRIAITKDPYWWVNEFSDCGCICRCICVTRLDDPVYVTPPPKMMVGSACMEELYIEGCGGQWIRGWAVTLVNSENPYDTEEILIWLEYDCETERTLVYTSVSDTPSAINCPDFRVGGAIEQDISWSVTPGGGQQPYLLTVRCIACRDCSLNQYVSTPCCPSDQLPPILTIEVTAANADCANLIGQIGSLIWNGDAFAPEWRGFLFGNEFILTCGGSCGTQWCLSGCGPMVQVGDGICDPFQLEFQGGGGCAACDEPATGDYSVTITE